MNPQPMPKEICCENFKGLFAYIQRHYDRPGIEKLTAGLLEGQYYVQDKYDPLKVVPVTDAHLTDPACWISNEFSLKLLSNVNGIVEGPNPLFTAGFGTIRENLSRTVLLAARVFGTRRLAQRAARLNARFNRTKTVELAEITDSRAVFELRYHPGFRVTKDVCNWNLGIYVGATSLSGVSDARGIETACVLDGAPCCRFCISWKKRPLFQRVFRTAVDRLLRRKLAAMIAEYERTIEERDHLIERLTASEQKYRTLFEESLEPMSLSHNGVLIDVNPAWLALHGFAAKSEVIGQDVIEFIHPEDRPVLTARRQHWPSNSGRLVQMRDLTRSGETREVEVYSSRIEYGGQGSILATVRDVSPQKEAERARRESEAARRKLEAHLQQAQKLEALGTLAGGIAHDFNNLLMSIQGNASLLGLEIDGNSGQTERLKSIEQFVQRGADLTRQLLGLAKGGKYEVRPTHLGQLVEKCAQMFGRTRKEIRIHHRHQRDQWSVEVDRGQIEQVMLNLFVNAWQAMPRGGELYLETGNVLLSERLATQYTLKPGRYVRAAVTDTGMGIDSAIRYKIFDPFFTTKKPGRGTGLGLASAYGIIKNHEGTILVDSEAGKGSTFSIYLPASAKRAAADRALPAELHRGSGRILLIDDEEIIINVGTQMLEKLGYSVLQARSGTQALTLFEQEHCRIDLVILDIIMPGMGGGAIFDKLRAIDPKARILISSGYSAEGQAAEILSRGCSGFLQKPFDIYTLSGVLKEIINGPGPPGGLRG